MAGTPNPMARSLINGTAKLLVSQVLGWEIGWWWFIYLFFALTPSSSEIYCKRHAGTVEYLEFIDTDTWFLHNISINYLYTSYYLMITNGWKRADIKRLCRQILVEVYYRITSHANFSALKLISCLFIFVFYYSSWLDFTQKEIDRK